MEAVGEHPVPAGPLAVRWLAYELPELRAGAVTRVRLALENAGSATWRSRGELGIRASYHWLDDRGNAVIWDAPRTNFPNAVAPGAIAEIELFVRAPRPPGEYVLAFDLLEETRFWFAEVGSHLLTIPVRVKPRIDERRLRVVVSPGPGSREDTLRSIAALDEPPVTSDAAAVAHIAAGAELETGWATRVLDAHASGFAAVGGAVLVDAPRSAKQQFAVWRGIGRNPSFPHPLLFPSLVVGLEPDQHLGLPAWTPDTSRPRHDVEPWLYDGRIVLRLRLPRGRRRA